MSTNSSPATPSASAPSQIRSLVRASWAIIIFVILLSLVPFFGFGAWFIGGPLLFITLIMGVIVLSRGGTKPGLLILLTSMIFAPIFIVIAPFISSFLGLAGTGAALQSMEQKSKNASATQTKTAQTRTYALPVAGGSSATASPTPVIADNRAEALAQAEKRWREIWVAEADTWIARSNNKRYLMQIKGRRAEVRPDTLTAADRLNDVQWRGTVAFHRSAQRLFGFTSSRGSLSMNQHDAGWNEWSPETAAVAVYRFKKQRNAWSAIEKDLYDNAQLDFGRDDMVRPSRADLRMAGIESTSQDSREDVAYAKARANFMSWLRAYFAKGQQHAGEQHSGYHAGAAKYRFTYTVTRDPVIQENGSKVKFEVFGQMRWHGQFNNGQGTRGSPQYYQAHDRVVLRCDDLDLSAIPFNGSFQWFFVDANGKEWRNSFTYSSIIRGCGFKENGFTLEPVVGDSGGVCDGRIASTSSNGQAVSAASELDTNGALGTPPGQATQRSISESWQRIPEPPFTTPDSSRTKAGTSYNTAASSPSGQDAAPPSPSETSSSVARGAAERQFPGERFPETRSRALAPADIRTWSDVKLQYAINEMFARHGAEFGNPATAKWFSQFPWYKPQPGSNFDDIETSMMADIERQNLQLLGAYRTAKREALKQGGSVQRNQRGRNPGTKLKKDEEEPDPIAEQLLGSILRGLQKGFENRR